jgi:hypothetical protein
VVLKMQRRACLRGLAELLREDILPLGVVSAEMDDKPSESVVVDATADFGRQQEQRRVGGVGISTARWY